MRCGHGAGQCVGSSWSIARIMTHAPRVARQVELNRKRDDSFVLPSRLLTKEYEFMSRLPQRGTCIRLVVITSCLVGLVAPFHAWGQNSGSYGGRGVTKKVSRYGSHEAQQRGIASHQRIQAYVNRPAGTRGWLCVFSGTLHPGGPNECQDPHQGGRWLTGNDPTIGNTAQNNPNTPTIGYGGRYTNGGPNPPGYGGGYGNNYPAPSADSYSGNPSREGYVPPPPLDGFRQPQPRQYANNDSSFGQQPASSSPIPTPPIQDSSDVPAQYDPNPLQPASGYPRGSNFAASDGQDVADAMLAASDQPPIANSTNQTPTDASVDAPMVPMPHQVPESFVDATADLGKGEGDSLEVDVNVGFSSNIGGVDINASTDGNAASLGATSGGIGMNASMDSDTARLDANANEFNVGQSTDGESSIGFGPLTMKSKDENNGSIELNMKPIDNDFAEVGVGVNVDFELKGNSAEDIAGKGRIDFGVSALGDAHLKTPGPVKVNVGVQKKIPIGNGGIASPLDTYNRGYGEILRKWEEDDNQSNGRKE